MSILSPPRPKAAESQFRAVVMKIEGKIRLTDESTGQEITIPVADVGWKYKAADQSVKLSLTIDAPITVEIAPDPQMSLFGDNGK